MRIRDLTHRLGRLVLYWLLLQRACPEALAQEPSSPSPVAKSAGSVCVAQQDSPFVIPYQSYALPNGLQVILHHDPGLPRVAVSLWYHVGPANEPRGRSGFAHLFEHLMFAGSRHVGPDFDRLMEEMGATGVNGTTSWDRTNYFETVPREYLERVLWIESDRMGFLLDGVGQEQLDLQRDVVKNERRQAYEDAPYGPSQLKRLDTVYPAGHPYHGAIIGSMEDLSAATLADVQSFYASYYAPSNATLTIAGDFDPEPARALVEKYFGPLRSLPKPPLAQHAQQPTTLPQRLEVKEPVEVPRVTFTWTAPPAYDPDEAPLSVAAAILAQGKASRLYRQLVVKEKLALSVDADLDANQLGSLVTVSALAMSSVPVARVEQSLDRELERLAKGPVTDAELERAKRAHLLSLRQEIELLNDSSGESGRAGILQRLNHYLGDPGALPCLVEKLQAVSGQDVQRVTKTHLARSRRVTVVTVPASTQGKKP